MTSDHVTNKCCFTKHDSGNNDVRDFKHLEAFSNKASSLSVKNKPRPKRLSYYITLIQMTLNAKQIAGQAEMLKHLQNVFN